MDKDISHPFGEGVWLVDRRLWTNPIHIVNLEYLGVGQESLGHNYIQ